LTPRRRRGRHHSGGRFEHLLDLVRGRGPHLRLDEVAAVLAVVALAASAFAIALGWSLR
jgi:hypothetical protein